MSSDLLNRALMGAPAVTLNFDPPAAKLTRIGTATGQKLLIPSYQLPNVNPNKLTTNLWRYSASGNFTTILQTGGQVSIKIDRGSGSGKVRGDTILRLLITNTNAGAEVGIVPAPFLINQLSFQTPSGDTIQNWDGFSLWFALIATTSFESWQSTSSMVDASDDYEQGPTLLRSSVNELLIPIRGSYLSAGELFWPAVDGDGMVYVTFATPTTTVISGSSADLSLTALSLDLEMDQADAGLQRELLQEYRSMEHNFIVPFMRVQNFTQTFSASTQYNFPLSGIKGDVVFMAMVLRSSINGEDSYHGRPITSFQLQNSEGVAISGAQFVTDEYNRHQQGPRWWLGTWMENRHIYSYVFGAESGSGPAFLSTGQKNGSYTFTTNEALVVNTAPSGGNEIWTVTASAGAAASGSYSLVWSTPDGGIGKTAPIAFGANGATIKAALELLPNFQGLVTVSAAMAAATTFTFSGNYANKPLYNQGYYLSVVESTVATAAPAVINYNVAMTTAGIPGITNGNTYTLSIYAFTSAILSLKGGAFRVQNS